MMRRVLLLANRLRNNRSGVALLEFAFMLPIFLTMVLTGTELTNYVITRQRVSQMALHLADNSARIGSGSMLQAKTITETDINDLLTGTGLLGGELDIYTRGRVVITSIEPMTSPNTAGLYKVGWQRCRGSRTYNSPYDNQLLNITGGYGPAGRQVTAPDYGSTMFVEVHYEYRPLIKTSLSPSTTMTEVASMMVRDRRDLTRIYNNENAPVSSCT